MSSNDSSSLSLRSLKARAFNILLGICSNQLFELCFGFSSLKSSSLFPILFSKATKVDNVTALISLFQYLEVENCDFL